MRIEPTHRQNFGKIMAPEGYVNHQIAQVKNKKGRKIVKGLFKIVDQSDVVDVFVDKNGKCTLNTKTKKLSEFVRIITGAKRKENIRKSTKENNFIRALIRGAYIDSKNSRYIGIHTADEENLHTFLKQWNDKYKILMYSNIYGINNLIKMEEPIKMGIRTIDKCKF